MRARNTGILHYHGPIGPAKGKIGKCRQRAFMKPLFQPLFQFQIIETPVKPQTIQATAREYLSISCQVSWSQMMV
ncbi:MAG TPA: hypothetical protein PKL29_10120, partial [Methanothrix sp.]|nr:hypothetical protein [Methanothrix sp.]